MQLVLIEGVNCNQIKIIIIPLNYLRHGPNIELPQTSSDTFKTKTNKEAWHVMQMTFICTQWQEFCNQ